MRASWRATTVLALLLAAPATAFPPADPPIAQCAMSANVDGVARMHLGDFRLPGTGQAVTFVFVGGQPVLMYRWDYDGRLSSATILANLWTLTDEPLAEEFIAKVRDAWYKRASNLDRWDH